MIDTKERWIGPEELAQHLGLTRASVYNLRTRGELPPARHVGRQLRWRLSEIDSWLETQPADRHSA